MILQTARRTIAVFLFLIAAPLTVHADDLSSLPSGNYPLDLSHASVVWKVSHLGFSSYVGRFTDFTADLVLDSEDFTKSSVAVDIKVDSIATAYPWPEKENFDQKLSNDWFKSAEYPSINFTSTSVSALKGNSATVTGDLTLLGQTQQVSLDVILNKAVASHPFAKKPAIGFSATTLIDRTQWGLSNYAPAVGAEVEIAIEGEFLFQAQ